MTQENALVKRCQHGDRQAFDELIRLRPCAQKKPGAA